MFHFTPQEANLLAEFGGTLTPASRRAQRERAAELQQQQPVHAPAGLPPAQQAGAQPEAEVQQPPQQPHHHQVPQVVQLLVGLPPQLQQPAAEQPEAEGQQLQQEEAGGGEGQQEEVGGGEGQEEEVGGGEGQEEVGGGEGQEEVGSGEGQQQEVVGGGEGQQQEAHGGEGQQQEAHSGSSIYMSAVSRAFPPQRAAAVDACKRIMVVFAQWAFSLCVVLFAVHQHDVPHTTHAAVCAL